MCRGWLILESYFQRKKLLKNKNWLGILIQIGVETSRIEKALQNIFFYEGAPISWSSTKEPVVALSSYEAEYIAAYETACQANSKKVKLLLVDNKSVIDLARHPTTHGRSKHIDTRFHFLREQVSNEKLQIEHCRTEIQFADIFTKALKREKFRDVNVQLYEEWLVKRDSHNDKIALSTFFKYLEESKELTYNGRPILYNVGFDS
ncbi:hypothetical protein CR513_27891, partial [Mucuna pruriens]